MRRPAGALLAVAIALGVVAAPAGAATFKPTRGDDPNPGKCKPDDCSLREAVLAANKATGIDTVKLGRGTYRLQIPTEFPDAPESGDLDLTGPATVKGKGGKTLVKGSGSGRIFDVGPTNRTVRPNYTLRGMAIKGGSTAGEDGGAIQVGFSQTRLSRLTVSRSDAVRGGGIAAADAELTIDRTTLRGNTASYGGGFFAPAASTPTEVTIKASTISGNHGSTGGGIALDGLNGPGIDDEPILDVVNSTVAGNDAFNGGGGMVALNGATINLDNVTIAYNDARSDDEFGSGGGIEQLGSSVITAADSVVAANTVGNNGSGAQCFGTLQTSSGNLFQTPADATCSYTGTNTADALLGQLAKNGGPTKTVKLLSGSPAIALADTCPAEDQRGKPRPATDCDAGAFERKGP